MLSTPIRRRFSLLLPLVIQFGVLLPNAHGASCTTQSQMTSTQRDSLVAAAHAMATQIQRGDVQGLRASTIPSVAADFSGIIESVAKLRPLVQQATITIDALYILDASGDPAGSSKTEFFCGSPVVALSFTDLPPGTYALVILHATGVPQPQQISLILSKTPDNHWMLGGFIEKPMTEAGHDGLWYWVSARKYAQAKSDWGAWLYYRQAALLLDPLDLMSTPNLEKLQHECDALHASGLPITSSMALHTPDATFTITAIDTTTVFHALDLEVHYIPDPTQASQLHDPLSARKQVTDIMLALITQHPELRDAFHGIWVRADQGTASMFALELPMSGIVGSISSPSTNTNPSPH